uniref:Otopetrin-2 n=1 Tax=Macrostomum lignano TaxID=282301 RepID=A0A1I8GDC2_9PLAT
MANKRDFSNPISECDNGDGSNTQIFHIVPGTDISVGKVVRKPEEGAEPEKEVPAHLQKIRQYFGKFADYEDGSENKQKQPSQLAFTANHRASTCSSILQSLLTLYGLVVLMHGVVIPISDALAKPVEHAAYRQMFYIFMHGVGIICIIYLNSLISLHQRRAKKRAQRFATAAAAFSSEGLSVGHSPQTVEIPMAHLQEAAADALETDPVSPELPHNGADHQGTVPLATTEADAADEGLLSTAPDIGGAAGSQIYRPRRRMLKRNPLVTDLPPVLVSGRRAGQVDERYLAALKVNPITQSETGINLYLRLGAIVFGFGVMIHDGFKISEVIERKSLAACHDMWFIPKQVVHLVFIMAQTYYLFKHHRITFNTQLLLTRFMMVHLIVTNLCIWVKTVIYEIKVGLTADSHNALKSHPDGGVENYTGNGTDCHENLLDNGPSHKLGPYLYPCAVEYGLICAAICFKVFSKIGDTKVTPYGRKMYPEGPRFTACHKSHKGLFLGLLIMICVLVPMISLQMLNSDKNPHQNIYTLVIVSIECLVLLFTSAMSVTGIVKTVRHLRLYRVRGNEAFDVNLLFVGLAGILCFNLFVAISVGSCAVDSSDISHCPTWIGHKNIITKAAGLKTLFIMQAIQRRITLELVENNHKPGRGLTIGLLIANLAMWIEAVFEAKRTFAEDFPNGYFGKMAWSIVKYIFLPLIIFFRFHSSVCLSEIWIRSYKMPKKRAAE